MPQVLLIVASSWLRPLARLGRLTVQIWTLLSKSTMAVGWQQEVAAAISGRDEHEIVMLPRWIAHVRVTLVDSHRTSPTSHCPPPADKPGRRAVALANLGRYPNFENSVRISKVKVSYFAQPTISRSPRVSALSAIKSAAKGWGYDRERARCVGRIC
jgi:hypothetical protein